MEKDIPINEKFMPKTFKLRFLEKNSQTELSQKENELLDRDFGYQNIDELIAAFNNIKTKNVISSVEFALDQIAFDEKC